MFAIRPQGCGPLFLSASISTTKPNTINRFPLLFGLDPTKTTRNPLFFSSLQPLAKLTGVYVPTHALNLYLPASASIQRFTRGSRTVSGTAPRSKISSWNFRTSNFAPSRFSASVRSSRIFSCPSL